MIMQNRRNWRRDMRAAVGSVRCLGASGVIALFRVSSHDPLTHPAHA